LAHPGSAGIVYVGCWGKTGRHLLAMTFILTHNGHTPDRNSQCSSLLPYRGVLSFRSEDRGARSTIWITPDRSDNRMRRREFITLLGGAALARIRPMTR
jgi:hypothetical protein